MSSPQPLGYHGLNLDITAEMTIDNAPLHELVNLLDTTATTLNTKHYIDNEEAPAIMEDSPTDLDDLSDMEKIGLIRALCDRIEIKLMEIAR